MSGAYDERLLASAPLATRAEKQGGYDIDLLEDPHAGARGASVTPPPAPLPSHSANHSKAELGGGGYTYASPPPLPWYKTRKWIFIFVLAGLVVIGAVVGGAVGGTVGHSDKASNALTTEPAKSDGGGAAGPVVSQEGSGGGGGGQGQAATNTVKPDGETKATNSLEVNLPFTGEQTAPPSTPTPADAEATP